MSTSNLTIPQILDILEHQAERNMKFGEWAVELGYLNQDHVNRLLKTQNDARPNLAKLFVEMGAIQQSAMDAVVARCYQGLKTCLSIAPAMLRGRQSRPTPHAPDRLRSPSASLLLVYIARAMRARRASRTGLLARAGSVRD